MIRQNVRDQKVATLSWAFLGALSLLMVTLTCLTAHATEPVHVAAHDADLAEVDVVLVAHRSADIKPFAMAVTEQEQQSSAKNAIAKAQDQR
jgi:hypothetical protein